MADSALGEYALGEGGARLVMKKRRNRALVVGINDYPGVNSDLSGCVNDANDWAELLVSRDFAVNILLDGNATKAHIVEMMQDIVARTGYGETGLIQYSGHGTWIPDLDGDEPDRRDEALCPHDIADGKLITDDEIAEVFSAKRHGARIVLISDSCHSGSVQRLIGPIGASRDKVRFLAPGAFLDGRDLQRAARALPTLRSRSRAKVRANVSVLLSGCQDWEYSYDAWFGQRANGAFSYVSLMAWRAVAPGASYQEWMDRIRTTLPSQDYPQTPQLSGRRYMRRWKALA